jgi:hypothetical protein
MLIAHYPLNGNARDYFGNDGTTSGSASYVDGKISKCLDVVRGLNNHVEIPHNTQLSSSVFGVTATFSFSFWFKARSLNSYGTIISKASGGSWSNTTSGVWTYSGGVRFLLGINTGGNAANSISYIDHQPTLDEWNHYSCISNDVTKEIKMYVNGILYQTNSFSHLLDRSENSAPILIGGSRYKGISEGVDGQIDDFRIYDHALSEKEVQETYKALVLSKFPEVNDNTVNSGNFITVPDSPTILGSTSIEMWLYPTSTARQTIWNNGYGGEGTINFERSSRELRFYSGYGGGNGGGYESLDSSAIPLNVWTHVVVTRAMPSGDVKWYINGQLDNTGNFSFSTIGETTFDLTIGTGYTNDFVGKLQGVRQYATVLSATDVESRYKTGLAIDNIGNMHGKYLAESGIINPNILDYTTWTIGTNGSQSGFSANGGNAENKIVSDIDPFGKEVTVWETIGEPDSNSDGGWNGSYFPIDETKFYRFSVWIRRTVIGSGSTYFGLRGGTMIRRDSGSGTSNPYFWSGGWGFDVDEWVLLVGHAWPSGSGTGADHVDSGRYTVTDGRVANISRDYVIPAGRTSLAHRAYLYYSTDVSTIQQFLYPRVDVLDGTEPSIQALLGGFDSVNYDRTHDELGSTSVPDKPSIKYDKLNVGQFSEVGVTRGLVSWLPLKGDTKDRVTNEVATNNGATPVGDGYEFDGVDDYVSIGEPDLDFTSHHWTACFFMFPREDGGIFISPSSSGNDHFFRISEGSVKVQYCEEADTNNRSIGASVPLNEWTHVSASISPDLTIRLYINGALQATETNTIPIAYWTNNWVLGSRGNGTYHSDIILKELKVFDRVLTSEEVAQEYKSGKASLNKNSAFAKEFIEV